MKKVFIFAVCFTILLSNLVMADMTSQITAAEESLGIDNSDKKVVERIELLEDELGLDGTGMPAVERMTRIENELGISVPQGSAIEEEQEDIKDNSAEENQKSKASYYFKNFEAVTNYCTIRITDWKIISPGEEGNTNSIRPIIAFWYDMTNTTDHKINPKTTWLLLMKAMQGTGSDNTNKLIPASLPDERFKESQDTKIEEGVTVSNAVAYRLNDIEDPIELIAKDSITGDTIGSMVFIPQTGEGVNGEDFQEIISDEEGNVSSTESLTSEESDTSEDEGNVEMEDYTELLPEGDSLFINQSPGFYYYEQLSEEEQALYDAMWIVVQDPVSDKYRKKVPVAADPASEEFEMEMTRALHALENDHPELFWLRQRGSFRYYYLDQRDSSGCYSLMVQLSRTYDGYEEEMTAFNSAVQDFLSEIDLTAPDPLIALEIHDRLIDMVSFDKVLVDETLADEELAERIEDYSFTAYGALVENSRGEAHKAVGDGYTYAYQYLLQQAGIEAVRVAGYAGDSIETAEGHSWNVIHLDDGWYEVDASWDDSDPGFDQKDPDNWVLNEAVNDRNYWDRIRHYMYGLTTEEISSFVPDDSYTYYLDNDEWTGHASFIGPSVHIRDSKEQQETTHDYITYLAPVAYGNTYTYDYLVNWRLERTQDEKPSDNAEEISKAIQEEELFGSDTENVFDDLDDESSDKKSGKDIDTDTIVFVQERLNAFGYDCGTPDGVAGQHTKDAIMDFQLDQHLDATGEINDELLELMSWGMPLGVYEKRYNEAVDAMNAYAALRGGYTPINHIYFDENTEEYNPNGNMFLIINPDYENKKIVGLINLTNKENFNTDVNITMFEMACAFYAQSLNYDSIISVLDVIDSLFASSDSTYKFMDVSYTAYNFSGIILITGKTDGFDDSIIKNPKQEREQSQDNNDIEETISNVESSTKESSTEEETDKEISIADGVFQTDHTELADIINGKLGDTIYLEYETEIPDQQLQSYTLCGAGLNDEDATLILFKYEEGTGNIQYIAAVASKETETIIAATLLASQLDDSIKGSGAEQALKDLESEYKDYSYKSDKLYLRRIVAPPYYMTTISAKDITEFSFD